MSSNFVLRRAGVADIKGIHQLLLRTAAEGLLLPRPLGDLYKHVRDFYVVSPAFDAESENMTEGGTGKRSEILGCCALSIIWDDIAEIRSLVMEDELRGLGWGAKLVDACLGEARELGLARAFTLTYQDGFFSKLGFKVINKDVLPNKIWADCIHCAKFPDCDEIAMLLEL
ncbi:MAG: N-acetyltransferase [Deltaproteobacteria bacterium]|jgi:amino-acid N-acetyltransferase|nr:N-acetyltransferase [Deltaproteobacteria bacterium]